MDILGIEFIAWNIEIAPAKTSRPNAITGGSSHNFERLPDEEFVEPVEDFGFAPARATRRDRD